MRSRTQIGSPRTVRESDLIATFDPNSVLDDLSFDASTDRWVYTHNGNANTYLLDECAGFTMELDLPIRYLAGILIWIDRVDGDDEITVGLALDPEGAAADSAIRDTAFGVVGYKDSGGDIFAVQESKTAGWVASDSGGDNVELVRGLVMSYFGRLGYALSPGDPASDDTVGPSWGIVGSWHSLDEGDAVPNTVSARFNEHLSSDQGDPSGTNRLRAYFGVYSTTNGDQAGGRIRYAPIWVDNPGIEDAWVAEQYP